MRNPVATACGLLIVTVMPGIAFSHPGHSEANTDSIPGESPILLALADDTRLFTGHDYKQGGRPARWQSSVGEQKRDNIHFRNNPDRAIYVAQREARDRTLPMPRLILHALQFNMRGGRLPEPEANGRSYLKIPIGAL